MTPEQIAIVEACQKVLLKLKQPVRGHNGYPYEAVATANILGLKHLVESELKGLNHSESKTDTITT